MNFLNEFIIEMNIFRSVSDNNNNDNHIYFSTVQNTKQTYTYLCKDLSPPCDISYTKFYNKIINQSIYLSIK